MKKLSIFLLSVFVLILFTACSNRVEDEAMDDNGVTTEDLILDEDEVEALEEAAGITYEDQTEVNEGGEVTGVLEDGERKFKVYGRNYVFYIDGKANPDIIVNEGKTVSITLKSDDEMKHDFVIDELGVKSNTVSGAALTAVDFVADKKGTYSYYCSVGSHRVKGMEGTLIVQ
ncbi:hypothetical protein GF354_00855 [Candidatus Peregrinibacteria bacterium]|nr:hypothetical protein [Candidatus Peregrinibacteria bacterium]